MKLYRGPDGAQRLWFAPDEIEQILSDELRKARLLPDAASPVVKLEEFVEEHLGATLDQHAELEEDVLGMTEFLHASPPQVSINRSLTTTAIDDRVVPPGAIGRWRATLAHEAAHIVLHRVLFELPEGQTTLFEAGVDPPHGTRLMRCLRREISFSRMSSDWREVQANQGMAALLMPREVFRSLVRDELESMGVSGGFVETGTDAAVRLTARLADRCGVSRQAAGIRIQTLNLVHSPGHVELPLI